MATRFHSIIFVLIVQIAGFTALAQSPKTPTDSLDQLRREGYDALYNLDYESARRRFHRMMELAPDHPAGAQCLAASLWLQQLNESWELKATLYSDKSYARENKTIDAERTQEFRKWIKQAKQLARVRLQKDSSDREALYFLGAAEGLEAAFSAAVERKFMAALRAGSESVEHHRAVLKLSPGFHDAQLTVGLYNYIVGALPLPVKILAGSMGVRGSRKRGLETLERVSKEGNWARDIARVLLVDLYKREKRWLDAISVSRELAEKYPGNYLFKLQIADALTAQALISENASTTEQEKIFEALLTEKTNDATVLDLVRFRYGETLLLLGKSERASKEFRRVVAHESAEAVLRTMSRLRLAQCLDVDGKRTEALALYRMVLAGPEGEQFAVEVRRGLREPYLLINSGKIK